MTRVTLDLAEVWSKTLIEKRQVGALLVKDRMIISDGYNGTPAGFETNGEDEEGKTYSLCTSRRGKCYNKGGQIGPIAAPVLQCSDNFPLPGVAKLIIQPELFASCFRNNYRRTDGVDLLTKAELIVVILLNNSK